MSNNVRGQLSAPPGCVAVPVAVTREKCKGCSFMADASKWFCSLPDFTYEESKYYSCIAVDREDKTDVIFLLQPENS